MNPARLPHLAPRRAAFQRLLLAAVCAGLVTAAEAGPSNLWTDNVLSESQAIPLTTPNQGLARARQLMADGDYVRAARALNRVAARWPTSEEARQLLEVSLQKAEAAGQGGSTAVAVAAAEPAASTPATRTSSRAQAIASAATSSQ